MFTYMQLNEHFTFIFSCIKAGRSYASPAHQKTLSPAVAFGKALEAHDINPIESFSALSRQTPPWKTTGLQHNRPNYICVFYLPWGKSIKSLLAVVRGMPFPSYNPVNAAVTKTKANPAKVMQCKWNDPMSVSPETIVSISQKLQDRNSIGIYFLSCPLYYQMWPSIGLPASPI